MVKELKERFPVESADRTDEELLRMEERTMVTSLIKGENFSDVLWRERLARLVQCYSKVQDWELDLLTGVKPQGPNKFMKKLSRQNAKWRRCQKARVAVQLEKTCARWLGHNELLSK